MPFVSGEKLVLLLSRSHYLYPRLVKKSPKSLLLFRARGNTRSLTAAEHSDGDMMHPSPLPAPPCNRCLGGRGSEEEGLWDDSRGHREVKVHRQVQELLSVITSIIKLAVVVFCPSHQLSILPAASLRPSSAHHHASGEREREGVRGTERERGREPASISQEHPCESFKLMLCSLQIPPV